MEIDKAKEIISALAEGVDPTTGEILPSDSVCNKGEVVRALYAVLNYVNTNKQKNNLPENAGKPWTRKDEARLLDLYRSGATKREICKTLQRTASAIAARLVHLREIENRDVFRNRI